MSTRLHAAQCQYHLLGRERLGGLLWREGESEGMGAQLGV